MRRCEVEGCAAPHMARGWCTRHHTHWLRHGDPEAELQRRLFTPREDEHLLALPTGPTGRVKNGGIAELAIMFGRRPDCLVNRRRYLLGRVPVHPGPKRREAAAGH